MTIKRKIKSTIHQDAHIKARIINFCIFQNSAQSILEYSLLLGMVVVVLITMSPGVKRSIQSMVKLTADQIGTQQNAEQIVTPESGYLISSTALIQSISNKQVSETFGDITYNLDDRTVTNETTGTSLGFQEDQ